MAHGQPFLGDAAADLGLDGAERGDAPERLLGDGRAGLGRGVDQLTARMCPALPEHDRVEPDHDAVQTISTAGAGAVQSTGGGAGSSATTSAAKPKPSSATEPSGSTRRPSRAARPPY